MFGINEKGQVNVPAAKGAAPQNFKDPATDHLMSMVMELMTEFSVMRDRLDSVERLIEEQDLFRQADIDAYQLSDDAAAARARRHESYVARVLKSIRDDLDQVIPKSK